eukprot:985313-Prymnesium_polylepis.1
MPHDRMRTAHRAPTNVCASSIETWSAECAVAEPGAELQAINIRSARSSTYGHKSPCACATLFASGPPLPAPPH